MPAKRYAHPDNAPGDWYIDTACIDCGAACNLAPGLIVRSGGQSVFARQPASPGEEAAAWRAALACPTASVHTHSHRAQPAHVFPDEIGPGVYRCGFNSRKSYGAHSYFVARPDGNFLVDSPRYLRALGEFFDRHGGLAHVLLTHRDDVADAERYARRFSSRVWIHARDKDAAPFATDLIRGNRAVEIHSGMLAVPTPGHTYGSVCYVLEGEYLFTGDTLAWSDDRQRLHAHRDHCWYSWAEQKRSLSRLVEFDFRYILAGHGGSQRLPREVIEQQLRAIARS